MAAIATPTNSPARSTVSKRWPMSASITPSTRTASCARLLDGRGGVLAVRGALSEPVVRPRRRAPASPRRPTSSRSIQNETIKPTWYEKKLWHLYDCTDYAGNLFNCPTVAYSGENDSQKQAADMMEVAMKREGLTLMHIIGGKSATPTIRRPRGRELGRQDRPPRHPWQGHDADPRPIHDLHAPLQRLVLGARRRPGQALGAGRRRCRGS